MIKKQPKLTPIGKLPKETRKEIRLEVLTRYNEGEILSATSAAKWLAETYNVKVVPRNLIVALQENEGVVIPRSDPTIVVEEELISIDEQVKHDREIASLKAEISVLRKKYDAAIKESNLEAAVTGLMRDYRDAMPIPKVPQINTESPKRVPTKETLVIVLSDLHVGETVSEEAMHGINYYDINVFLARMDAMFEKIRMIAFENLTGYQFEEVRLYLLGDLVNGMYGAMHDELIITQAADLMETVYGTAYVLVQVIAMLRQLFERVVVCAAPGNHGRMCFDSETELMTNRGWLLRSELTREDIVGTLNPTTKEFEWQSLKDIHDFSYSGDMIKFENTQVNSLVTPEHDIYVRSTGSENRGYTYDFNKRKAGEREWGNHWKGLGAAQGWRGAIDSIVLPSTQLREGYEIAPTKDFAEFLGWYVSEGVATKNPSEGSRVTICQSVEKNPDKYERIRILIKNLGYEPRLSNKYIRFSDAPLNKWLLETFGNNSKEKHLPQWLMDWPVELLESFLHGLFEGDGYWESPTSGCYTTSSDQLVDDIQQIAVKLGWSTSAKDRYFGINSQGYSGSARKIHFRRSAEVAMGTSQKVYYDGDVWCPEVENGLVFVRRGGQVMVSGNSRKPMHKTPHMNWDMIVPQIASTYFHNDKNVVWNLPQSFFFIDQVYGETFLGLHGHQVKGWASIPWYGINKTVGNLATSMDHQRLKDARETSIVDVTDLSNLRINNVVMGHFHQEALFERIGGAVLASGCFVPYTPISTKLGVRKNIQDIQVGDNVLTHTGEYKPVSDTFVRDFNGYLVGMGTRTVNSRVRMTPEHPVRALKGSQLSVSLPYKGTWIKSDPYLNPRWIEAENIGVGDYVQLGRPQEIGGEGDLEFSRLLGLYLAEGHVTNTYVEWTFHINEKEYANFVERKCKEFGWNVRQSDRPDRNTRSVRANSRVAADMFLALGNKMSWGKVLAPEVMAWPTADLEQVLIGWLQGDGHVRSKAHVDRVVSGTSVSKALIEQLNDVSLQAGYSPTIWSIAKGGPRKRDSYTLGFGGKDALKLANIMGKDMENLSDGKSETVWLEGIPFRRINYVWRERYEGPVHNLEVVDNHSYVANGFVAHNCMKGPDEFSLGSGFSPSPASQLMFGVHRNEGISHRWNLHLQDHYESRGLFEWWPGGTLNEAWRGVSA